MALGTPILLYKALYGWAGVLLLSGSLYALLVELLAVKQGDNSTISEVTWDLWALQPWVLWLPSTMISNIFGFWLGQFYNKDVLILVNAVLLVAVLCGHFFAQARGVYTAIRKGESPERGL